MTPDPIISCACAFPPLMGFKGACTTFADLSRHGLVKRLWTPNKRAAVRLLTDRNLALNVGYGHGNRAARMLKALR
jgi:hypothetical protein